MTQVIKLVQEERQQVSRLSDRVKSIENSVQAVHTFLQQSPDRPQLAGTPQSCNISNSPVFTPPSIVFAQTDVAPKFLPQTNKTVGPSRYLEELEVYFRKRNISDEGKLEIALEGLQGYAKNWAIIYRDGWTNYNDFKRDFLKNFWSSQDQGRIRQIINTSKWSNRFTMTEHFAHFVSLARLLTNPIPEPTLVEDLIRHYPTHIQALWSLKSDHSLPAAAAFLKQQEDIVNFALPVTTSNRVGKPVPVGTHRFTPYHPPKAPFRPHPKRATPPRTMQWSRPQGNSGPSR